MSLANDELVGGLRLEVHGLKARVGALEKVRDAADYYLRFEIHDRRVRLAEALAAVPKPDMTSKSQGGK